MFIRLLAASFCGLITVAAGAQTPGLSPSDIPSQVEPGRLPEARTDPAPEAFSFSIEIPGGTEVPADMADSTVPFESLAFEGMTVYEPSEFAELYARWVGKEIPLKAFFEIGQAVEERYHRDGYLLSFAYFPEQVVENGDYRLRVIEGFIDEVVVEGESPDIKARLLGILLPVTEEKPINTALLERRMLLARDLKGVSISGVLKPSETAENASILVVGFSTEPITASLDVNNYGSKYSGPWRGSFALAANSMVRAGDRTQVTITNTRSLNEQRLVTVAYGLPVGNHGTTVELAATYGSLEPGFSLAELEVGSKSLDVQLSASHPLLRRRDHTLVVTGGFRYRDSEIRALDERLSRDRVRSFMLDFTYNTTSLFGGATHTKLALAQGIPAFGASDQEEDPVSRADATMDFTTLRLGLDHLQPITTDVSALFSVAAMWSRDALLASEEFALGGRLIGRGYDFGELTGDLGLGAALELRYELPTVFDFVDRTQMYTFYDLGAVWNKNTPTGGRATLASTGLGARVDVLDAVTSRIEYAKPLTRPPSTEDGALPPKFLLGIGLRF